MRKKVTVDAAQRPMVSLRRGAVLVVVAAALGAACSGPDGGTSSTIGNQDTWYSMADQAAFIVECVRERGFSARVYEGIGIWIDDPQQQEAAEAAEAECSDEVEAAYPRAPPLSARESYDALRQTAECLRDQGVAVEEAPTFDTWIESDRQWGPYQSFTPNWDFWALHRLCPQPGLGLTPSTVPAER